MKSNTRATQVLPQLIHKSSTAKIVNKFLYQSLFLYFFIGKSRVGKSVRSGSPKTAVSFYVHTLLDFSTLPTFKLTDFIDFPKYRSLPTSRLSMDLFCRNILVYFNPGILNTDASKTTEDPFYCYWRKRNA